MIMVLYMFIEVLLMILQTNELFYILLMICLHFAQCELEFGSEKLLSMEQKH